MQPKIRNEARWRALILFGLNVATYKFAFAQALLDVAKSGQSTVSLDQLSLPYARHLIRHLMRSTVVRGSDVCRLSCPYAASIKPNIKPPLRSILSLDPGPVSCAIITLKTTIFDCLSGL